MRIRCSHNINYVMRSAYCNIVLNKSFHIPIYTYYCDKCDKVLYNEVRCTLCNHVEHHTRKQIKSIDYPFNTSCCQQHAIKEHSLNFTDDQLYEKVKELNEKLRLEFCEVCRKRKHLLKYIN